MSGVGAVTDLLFVAASLALGALALAYVKGCAALLAGDHDER